MAIPSDKAIEAAVMLALMSMAAGTASPVRNPPIPGVEDSSLRLANN